MPTYSIPVAQEQLRSITDPNDPTIRTIYALINVFDLPADLSLSPDPRVPKPSKVTRRIAESLKQWDGRFHILNRGIVISAHSADYDNVHGIMRLDIPDEDSNYGILDGGHTQLSIDDAVRDLSREQADGVPQYVRLEILLGVKEFLGRIASARNFSEDVKAVSLANYEKKLEWLKQAVHPYEREVRWSENDEGKIDALELLQILTAMNKQLFNATDHPLDAYKNTGKCLAYVTEAGDRYNYKKLSDLALSIWELYDRIRSEWWSLYSSPDADTGARGRPGAVKEVKARKRGARKLMHYVTLGRDGDPEQGDKHVEKGLAMPLLAGFRVLLTEGPDGKYVWLEDPQEFFSKHGQTLVRRIMELSD